MTFVSNGDAVTSLLTNYENHFPRKQKQSSILLSLERKSNHVKTGFALHSKLRQCNIVFFGLYNLTVWREIFEAGFLGHPDE